MQAFWAGVNGLSPIRKKSKEKGETNGVQAERETQRVCVRQVERDYKRLQDSNRVILE